jgi:competence protein ComFC
MCGSFSLLHICKTCQIEELEPSLYITYIDDVKVLSFYTYDKIKILLHTKHTDIGYYILNILASIAMKKICNEF